MTAGTFVAFTLSFIKVFAVGLWIFAPILLSIAVFILLLGQWVGRAEKWSPFDAAYWSLVTASTVGYGDFRPSCRLGKVLSIVIATWGLIFTGIVVGIAVQSAQYSLDKYVDVEEIAERVKLDSE